MVVKLAKLRARLRAARPLQQDFVGQILCGGPFRTLGIEALALDPEPLAEPFKLLLALLGLGIPTDPLPGDDHKSRRVVYLG